MHLVRRLRSAFWGAFQHGQFSIAKAGAYSSILTLFPAFLVITSLLEASHQTDVFIRQIAATVGWVLPPEPRSLVMSFFHANHHQTNRILFSAFIVTLLAATGVMISWMEGFRKAYGIPNTWGFWKERARALYLVFLALLPMTLATVLVVFGNQIEALVQRDMHLLRPVVLFFWMLGRWAIAILTSITFTALIYHHGMPKTQSWRRILPGAIMATALWFPATMIFGWYVTHYATYTVVYGSLGAAIALLVWLYILSVIVLVGAEFNALVYPKTIENE
jgi:membrane protein